MTATVKLSGALPKGDANGISKFVDHFTSDENIFTVVALVQTTKLTMELATNETVPTLAIRAVELILDRADANDARKLLRAQYVQRTGKDELPDLEDAIQAILTGPKKEEKK